MLASIDARAADSWRSVSDGLQSLQEASYIGGMPPKVHRIAMEARVQVQQWRNGPLPTCDAPDPSRGSVIATGVGVDPPVPQAQKNPVLSELQALLKHERRFVRDAAAYVIGEIGPAASTLEPDLSGADVRRSPWLTHALGRVSCERYAMNGDITFIPAGVRANLIGTEETSLPPGFGVRLLVKLLGEKQLAWPDGFFSSSIDPWEVATRHGAPDRIEPEAVLAIADRVMDVSAPQALRSDLLELLDGFGEASRPASEALWDLANGPNDELAFSAARVVMGAGGDRALDAAILLLERFHLELSVLPKVLCSAPKASEVLSPQVKKLLSGPHWSQAEEAAAWLGCLDPMGNAALLREYLDHPSWETQIAVIAALSPSAQRDPATQQALRTLQSTHWSGLVRQKAKEALHPPAPPAEEASDELSVIDLNCFHRCVNDHLRRCGDEDGIVDGLYVSPSMGELDIEWERARRVPVPGGFPIAVPEDSRPDYGTSTYLRVDGGWLYGTDRWHYDGIIGFVDDRGRASEIGEWGADVVAFLDTPHFGTVMLGGSIFSVGDAGLLAQVEHAGEDWKLVPRIALPSPPWGWAFAPNGTLLVADPYEAVAVLQDGRIESLSCPARKPQPQPRSLLAMARKAPRVPGVRAQRDANDALKAYESAFATQRARIEQLQRDPSRREAWEKPDTLQGRLGHALDEWLQAYLAAGRAKDALRTLESIPDDVAKVDSGRRFHVYAAAGQSDKARAQFQAMRAEENVGALKLMMMLALAENRVADAEVALDRIRELGRKSSSDQSDDPYLSLLQGLTTNDWRKPDGPADGLEGWPGPIRENLAGRSTEKDLALASHTRDGRIDREKLCEALFFKGLKFASEGKSRRARAHFRAVAELQIQDFHEHAVAMAVLGDRTL